MPHATQYRCWRMIWLRSTVLWFARIVVSKRPHVCDSLERRGVNPCLWARSRGNMIGQGEGPKGEDR